MAHTHYCKIAQHFHFHPCNFRLCFLNVFTSIPKTGWKILKKQNSVKTWKTFMPAFQMRCDKLWMHDLQIATVHECNHIFIELQNRWEKKIVVGSAQKSQKTWILSKCIYIYIYGSFHKNRVTSWNCKIFIYYSTYLNFE